MKQNIASQLIINLGTPIPTSLMLLREFNLVCAFKCDTDLKVLLLIYMQSIAISTTGGSKSDTSTKAGSTSISWTPQKTNQDPVDTSFWIVIVIVCIIVFTAFLYIIKFFATRRAVLSINEEI